MLFAVLAVLAAVLAAALLSAWINAEINVSVIRDSCGVVSRFCFYFGEVESAVQC